MTRRRENEKGIALLVTLLILVLVVALVHEVFRIGAQSAQTGAYGRDSIRCILLAEGGTGAARIVLRQDARDNQYDTLDEIWSRAALPITLGDGEVRVTIEDEERKIDLNRIMLPNGNAPDERRLAVFQRLLDTLGIDRAVADAVVDWLDNDENPRVGGAESSYYLGLPNPYRRRTMFERAGRRTAARSRSAWPARRETWPTPGGGARPGRDPAPRRREGDRPPRHPPDPGARRRPRPRGLPHRGAVGPDRRVREGFHPLHPAGRRRYRRGADRLAAGRPGQPVRHPRRVSGRDPPCRSNWGTGKSWSPSRTRNGRST